MARWTAVLIVSVLLFSTFAGAATTIPIKKHSEGVGSTDLGAYGYKLVKMKGFAGDGKMEIAVSAPKDSKGGNAAGAVYIFKGPFGQGYDLSSKKANLVITGQPGEGFGSSMDTGDFNSDGRSDLIIGAPNAGSDTGAAYLFLGGNSTNRTSVRANATFIGTWQGQGFGVSVANAGNLNGDRFDDFAIGEAQGNEVRVYAGRAHLRTGLLTLPEVTQDYPNPVDLKHGLNSTGNTFGWGNASDGWDWAPDIYGGTNADVHFPPVGGNRPFVSVVMGNQTDGNGTGPCPAASGGYGIDFNITQDYIDAIKDGAQLFINFTWTSTSKGLRGGGSGGPPPHNENYWVKARFWNSSNNIAYLGSSWDGDNNVTDDENISATTDGTNELFYMNWNQNPAQAETYSNNEKIMLNEYLNGAHRYYFDVGGKLADWSNPSQFLTVKVGNITLWTELPLLAVLMGPVWNAGYGLVIASAGDVNGDGYDDLIVGAPGVDETHVYFGSPHFDREFVLYEQWALPASLGKGDTTGMMSTNALKADDDVQWDPNQGTIRVDRGKSMLVDTWDIGRAKGNLLYAWFYAEYKTDPNYDGNSWVEWSVDGKVWKNTDLNPINSFLQPRYDGPYDMYASGLSTLEQLQGLDLRFNNTANGQFGKAVYFDYTLIFFISQQPSNVTIKGPAKSLFGYSVAGLGSINGDGYDDFIIGAPQNNKNLGSAYVFLGGNGIQGHLTDKDAFASFDGVTSGGYLGSVVASAGLFSLDKFPDIAVGAPGQPNGTIYIVRGGPRVESGRIKDVAQYAMTGEWKKGDLPMAVVALGDINGGHAGELLISDPVYSDGSGPTPGKVYIVYNSDEDLLKLSLIVDRYPKGDQVMNEGQALLFGVHVKAPSELTVSFKWYLDDILIGTGDHEFTYTTDYSSAGKHKVKVLVSDGFRSAEARWNVTVLDVNFPPVVKFYPPLDPTIGEGDSIRFWADATDPDNDPLTYAWTLDGTPVQDPDLGYVLRADRNMVGDHTVTLNVSDGHHTIGHRWYMKVDHVNSPPVIDSASPVSNPSVPEGKAQAFNITAHDPDGDPLTVVWSVDGLARALGTYAFDLVTEVNRTGMHTVLVTVSDGNSSVEHRWTLTVTKENHPPTIYLVRPASPVHLQEGDEAMFWISASDPDQDNLTTTWTLDGTRVIGDQSYDFRVPPSPKGEYALKVTVSDGRSNTTYTWRIIVNRGPRIDSWWPLAGRTLTAGKSEALGIKASDPDKDALTVTWSINGKDIKVDGIASSASGGNSSMNFMAPFGGPSRIDINVTVSDGRMTARREWRFNTTTVADLPPTAVITISPKAPKKGKTVYFDGTSSHVPEGTIVSYDWKFSDGSTASGKNVSKVFDQKGVLTVTLTVTDSRGNTGEATKALSFGNPKVQGGSEGPWGMIIFVILLAVLVALLLFQASRKGWFGGGKGDEGLEEDRTSRKADIERGTSEKKAPVPKEEEKIEGPFEEVAPEEQGEVGFEELPVDEEHLEK